MLAVDSGIAGCVKRMQSNAAGRDMSMWRIRTVRDGNLSQIKPGSFSDEFPEPMVANLIDVAARSLAESLAPLPSLKCSAGRSRTAADRRRAEKKNRIGTYYWRESKLEVQMAYGADQYTSYAFLPFRLEADYDDQCPKIIVDDPTGTYYENDRWGKCVRYARTWKQPAGELAAMYDDILIKNKLCVGEYGKDLSDTIVEVVFYVDGTREVLFVPDRENLLLTQFDHGLGFCPVHIALRPGLHKQPQGQFDQTIYIQVARAIFAQLALEAAHKTVQAPIVVPSDVTNLNIGPDAVMQTDQGIQSVGRVQLNVPHEAFVFDQKLDQEIRLGSRFVEPSQTGASVITGRGIEAMMGTLDSQIRAGQTVLGLALRTITSMAFRMDAELWPRKRKTISGTLSGESYSVTYTPETDIGDDYECDVTYGMAAGMSPQNAIVMLLQLRGDGLIDRDFFRQQLPFDLDTDAIQRRLDVEQLEDGVKQGLLAALQATGQIMATGQVDIALNFFKAAGDAIKGREQGKSMTDLVLASFEAQQQAAQEAAAQQQAQAAGGAPPDGGGGGAPGGVPGMNDTGLADGVAPGQAGMPPGGMPSIQQLVAGVTGGKANLGASVRRRIPTG